MLKLILFIVLGAILSYGTILVSDSELVPYECGPACDAVAEVSDKGFPVTFVDGEIEDKGSLSAETINSFDIGAFALNSVIWAVIAAAAFFIATMVLVQFGLMVLIVLVAVYLFGYSAVLAWL